MLKELIKLEEELNYSLTYPKSFKMVITMKNLSFKVF